MPPEQQQQPRRLAPQPIETSQKSSKKDAVEEGKEVSPKAPRKFAVQPVEESTKSSKQNGTKETPERPTIRKFAPEPVEQTTSSSKKPDDSSKPKSRFSPQPFETSSTSSRNTSPPEEPGSPKSAPAKPKRSFAPQLIDTSSRTRKSSDAPKALPITLKTDVTPSHKVKADGTPIFERPESPNKTRPTPLTTFLLPHERRRDRADSHGSRQRHSFISPDLDTIESSESEPSNPPSLSTSPSSEMESPLTGDLDMYKHATRIRESIDEGFSQYFLQLEAKRAEIKMREQALAAFANSDYHEPVEHYVDEEDDSDEMDMDDRPATWEGHDEEDEYLPPALKTFRRDTTKYNWELQEMKQHHESMEQEKAAMKTTAKREATTPSPWWKPDTSEPGRTGDHEYSQMMDRARPPMLGRDLKFPRSTSPEPARFDVTQGSANLLTSMCYLTEQSEGSFTNPKTADGLWGLSTPKNSHGGSGMGEEGGLWGGFCVNTNEETPGLLSVPSGPTGLMTPAPLEKGNPFEMSQPPTPRGMHLRPDDASMNRMDSVLNSEREIDQLMETEFNDTFITQVFNYLSLGYPSLARPFDEELSKIAKVPLSELRHDDKVAKSMPKGYIRLGDDFEGRDDGRDQELNTSDPPARWKALKSYIREWVRQEKGMVTMESFGGFGTAPRRGSWAW
ncbi:hypothetical protein MBLNU457_1618t1 [Dothideomycetes sp. NU457]